MLRHALPRHALPRHVGNWEFVVRRLKSRAGDEMALGANGVKPGATAHARAGPAEDGGRKGGREINRNESKGD